MADNQSNIAFIGKRLGRDPLLVINNGSTTIVLPEKQGRPFYHQEAKTIIKLYPWLYRKVVPKG